MAPYNPEQVRDQTLVLLDRLHKERERRLILEINDMQRRFRDTPSNSELKLLWGMEAKVEAQFAYMRRLIRTEGFVMRTMSDFDGLDTNGSGRLEPSELQDFVKKRDGATTKFTILEVRAKELLKDLDVDGDGRVDRCEWLMYMTYLHWQAFIEENVVEKVVEVTKEYKNDKTGTPVLVENIVQHPPQLRSNSKGNTLDNLRNKQGGNSRNDESVVERTHQNPDGSVVTTIEHMRIGEGTKIGGKKAGANGWCGICHP